MTDKDTVNADDTGDAVNTDDKGDSAAASDTPKKPEQSGHQVPKSRLDAEIAKRNAMEKRLDAIWDDVKSDIPEEMLPLVPEALPVAERIEWYHKAKSTFSTSPKVPGVDQSAPKSSPSEKDISNLPAHAKIAAGYQKTG